MIQSGQTLTSILIKLQQTSNPSLRVMKRSQRTIWNPKIVKLRCNLSPPDNCKTNQSMTQNNLKIKFLNFLSDRLLRQQETNTNVKRAKNNLLPSPLSLKEIRNSCKTATVQITQCLQIEAHQIKAEEAAKTIKRLSQLHTSSFSLRILLQVTLSKENKRLQSVVDHRKTTSFLMPTRSIWMAR